MKKILLSIKPKYVKQIFDGYKQVEYRKSVHTNKEVKWILIYETYPTMRVVGEFYLKGILKASPKEIWEKTKLIGGICKDDYFKYFEGKPFAYAYQISNLVQYSRPKLLSEYGIKRAPQSFQYIEIEDK